MTKMIKNITYYILLFYGLIMLSWILWARFLRQRTIRDIPDELFTELRFWILLYICCIYLYIVKNLIKPKEPNIIFSQISEMFFAPLTALDHLIKYNPFIQAYYNRLMLFFIPKLNCWTLSTIQIMFIIFQIIPRTILAIFLLFDTFYFLRLELFYKVVLIGLLPLVFRYFLYSLKDFSKHWINILEEKYMYVRVFEEGYEYKISRKFETQAIYHYKLLSITEYIEIKQQNILDNFMNEDFPYTYIGLPLAKEDVYIDYKLDKYKDNKITLTMEDQNIIHKLFEDLVPKILELNICLYKIHDSKDHPLVRLPKIEIFSIYFLCWSFILIISYYFYPVEFDLFRYLLRMEDPFSMLELYSMNINYIPPETVKRIVMAIINKIFN